MLRCGPINPNGLDGQADDPSTLLGTAAEASLSRFAVCVLCCAVVPLGLMGLMGRQTTRRPCLALLRMPRSSTGLVWRIVFRVAL